MNLQGKRRYSSNATRAASMPVPFRKARDENIRRCHEDGWSVRTIAEHYKLGTDRIRHIIKEH